jgi:hypothetical protein
MTWSSSGQLIRKMDIMIDSQFRLSTCLLCFLIGTLTANGILRTAWVIEGCPTADEYDYDVRGGKVYAVHRRTSPFHERIQAAFDLRR